MTKKKYLYEFTTDGEKEAAVGLVEIPKDVAEWRIKIELGYAIADKLKVDEDTMRVYDIDYDVLPSEYAFGGWKDLEQYDAIVAHGEVIDVEEA